MFFHTVLLFVYTVLYRYLSMLTENVQNNATTPLTSAPNLYLCEEQLEMADKQLENEFAKLTKDRFFIWANFTQQQKLNALFLKLVKQNRWIYFVHDEIKIKAEEQPILQVKLKPHHSQFECLTRIAQCGHTSAILVEKLEMNAAEFMALNQICAEANVLLVLLDQNRTSAKVH